MLAKHGGGSFLQIQRCLGPTMVSGCMTDLTNPFDIQEKKLDMWLSQLRRYTTGKETSEVIRWNNAAFLCCTYTVSLPGKRATQLDKVLPEMTPSSHKLKGQATSCHFQKDASRKEDVANRRTAMRQVRVLKVQLLLISRWFSTKNPFQLAHLVYSTSI